ncbi:hypothetical protein M0811_02768 [Anaeramoeba ignava]|uniref:MHD domain-containing protein n=1 Tax=Anaeramoeba ignava TaxID=1746090 RepID=A0A9Q0LA80_ANAIG|nr:hypothetical protein M0811_02768 [Anaeramoeba ignava]
MTHAICLKNAESFKNLFIQTLPIIPFNFVLKLSNKFDKKIFKLKKNLLKSQSKILNGQFVFQEKFRLNYSRIGDIYIITFTYIYDNIFHSNQIISETKNLLLALFKIPELQESQLLKKSSVIELSLERILHGEETTSLINHKILDSSPPKFIQTPNPETQIHTISKYDWSIRKKPSDKEVFQRDILSSTRFTSRIHKQKEKIDDNINSFFFQEPNFVPEKRTESIETETETVLVTSHSQLKSDQSFESTISGFPDDIDAFDPFQTEKKAPQSTKSVVQIKKPETKIKPFLSLKPPIKKNNDNKPNKDAQFQTFKDSSLQNFGNAFDSNDSITDFRQTKFSISTPTSENALKDSKNSAKNTSSLTEPESLPETETETETHPKAQDQNQKHSLKEDENEREKNIEILKQKTTQNLQSQNTTSANFSFPTPQHSAFATPIHSPFSSPTFSPSLSPSQSFDSFVDLKQEDLKFPTQLILSQNETINSFFRDTELVKSRILGTLSIQLGKTMVKNLETLPKCTIQMMDSDKIDGIILNNSFLQQSPDNPNSYILSKLSHLKHPVVVMKYSLKRDVRFDPVMAKASYKSQNNILDIAVRFKVHPIVDEASLILQIKGNVKRRSTKPQGLWNENGQKLMWKLNIPQQNLQTYYSRFEVEEITKQPPFLAKFSAHDFSISGISFELVQSPSYQIKEHQKTLNSGKYLFSSSSNL